MGNEATEDLDESEARRWIIGVTVKSRPGVAVEELKAILSDCRFDVTGADLGRDLSALDCGISTDPDGSSIVSPPDQETAEPPPQTLTVVATALAVVALFIGALIMVNQRDDSTTSAAPASKPTTTAPVTTGTAGTTQPAPQLPLVALPGLDTGQTVLTFDTPNPTGLGDFAGQGEWRALNGRWATNDGSATVVDPAPLAPGTLAVAPESVADANVLLNVQVPVANSATGVAFRVKDTATYWMLVLSRAYRTLSLVRVVGNQADQLTDAGALALPTDTVSIGIKAEGNRITGYFQGHPVISATDPDTSPGVDFGLVAKAGAPTAQFDNFIYKTL